MELTKKNDLVWDKAVQIMLTVESLQKNITSKDDLAKAIQKFSFSDGIVFEQNEIKDRITNQEELLLSMEKQVRETQAGLAHLALKNEEMERTLESAKDQSKTEFGEHLQKLEKKSRKLHEKQTNNLSNTVNAANAKIENAMARINETETRIRMVNRQTTMLEDAINAEKKRHHEEIQRLQASIVDNERLASVQENVNLLQEDLNNLRKELDGSLDKETPPSLKKLEYRVATMTGQLNREKTEAEHKVKSLTSWIKKIFAGVKKDFEGHSAILSNITAHQEKIDEDVNSLKIAIEKTLDDSNDLRRKLVQNDKDRDLRLAKLELTVKNKDDIADLSERIYKMEILEKKLRNHPELKELIGG